MLYKTTPPKNPKKAKGGKEAFFSPFPHLILLFVGPKQAKNRTCYAIKAGLLSP